MAFEKTSKGPEKAKPTPPSVEIETTAVLGLALTVVVREGGRGILQQTDALNGKFFQNILKNLRRLNYHHQHRLFLIRGNRAPGRPRGTATRNQERGGGGNHSKKRATLGESCMRLPHIRCHTAYTSPGGGGGA